MIILIQRVNHAKVSIADRCHAQIGRGLLAFVGIESNDTIESSVRLLDRVLAYRVFPDAEGRMNVSLRDVDGELLLVSQFTLAATTNQGLRPGFSSAMAPAKAEALYELLVENVRGKYARVKSGVFAADMKVELENDGPVTFVLKD
ncbi:MAG: D-aminoacyl-tRNA deacylase [Pseudohongiellaceae bacterium]